MSRPNLKPWLYLLPAILFLGVFMVYPLVDVLVYSVEEGYNSASQTYFGTGLYNYSYVLHDPYFLQAVRNTFILVIITVPVSTGIALLISLGLNSIKKLRELYLGLSDSEKEVLTDAARIYVMKGEPVEVVRGESWNIKITYPQDLEIAEAILRRTAESR